MSILRNANGGLSRLMGVPGGLLNADAGDTEAPTVPGSLTASAITETTLTLDWVASTDNVDVLSYEIEYAVDGDAFAWLATVAAPTVTLDVTGLTAGTAYRFRVLAEDAAGNLSGWEPDDTGLLVTTTAAFSFTDPTFNGTVRAIVDDGSGGKYVGGEWTSVTCNVTASTYTTGYERLIHLLPTGEVDAAWSCPASSTVETLAVDTVNDRLYVGGSFSTLGGATRGKVAAVVASTGIIDASWACNVTSGTSVKSVALDVANDRLYVGGSFATIGGVGRSDLAVITASTGVVDASWVCNVGGSLNCVALDAANDRLYVGGSFTTLAGEARLDLAAVVASTGAVVLAWVCDSSNSVTTLLVDATNDRLYVGGNFSTLGGETREDLAAVTASTGVVAASWVCNFAPTGFTTGCNAIALDAANDRLYVGGVSTTVGGEARVNLAAMVASTAVIDASWVCNASSFVTVLSLDSANDALFVGGGFNGATGLDGQQRDRFGTVVASTGDLFVP